MDELYNSEKDKYFKENLKKEDLSKAFKAELDKDSEMAEEFDFENLVRAGFTSEYKEQIQKAVEQVKQEKSNSSSNKKSKLIPMRWLSIAASLVLVVGAFVFFQKTDLDPDTTYLASLDDYQKITLSKLSTRSSSETTGFSDSLKTAIREMNTGNLEISEKYLNELIENHPTNEDVIFQSSVLNYFQNNYIQSDELIELVINSSSKEIKQEAEMMYVQVKLKTKQKKEAKDMLVIISNSPRHKYYARAKEVLKTL